MREPPEGRPPPWAAPPGPARRRRPAPEGPGREPGPERLRGRRGRSRCLGDGRGRCRGGSSVRRARGGSAREFLQLVDVSVELGHPRGGVCLLGLPRDGGLGGGGGHRRSARQREFVGCRGGAATVVHLGLDLAGGLSGRFVRLGLRHRAGQLLAVGAEIGALGLDDLARLGLRDHRAPSPRRAPTAPRRSAAGSCCCR